MRRVLVLLLACVAPQLAHAAPYVGDFIKGDTVRCSWATFNTTGDSTTPGTPGTVRAYKDSDDSTEVTTGITDTRAFDSNAGDHEVIVATTDAFYASGSDFTLRVRTLTVDGQDVNAPLCQFSIENRAPLKNAIIARGTIGTGSTTSVAVLGAVSEMTADNISTFVARVIENVNTKERQCITANDDNGSTDTVTFAPTVSSAWTNGQVWRVWGSGVPCYPVPTPLLTSDGKVVVGAFGTASNTLTMQGGANLAGFANAGGAATTFDLDDLATVLAAHTSSLGQVLSAVNTTYGGIVLAAGTCNSSSTTLACESTTLTQADDYWNNWSAIVVGGQPPRCIRDFVAANDRLVWPNALPVSAASTTFVLVAAPECRNFP